ncbi:MAG: MATE family efflux transporter [Pseudomonadota bacterium]|nr:MATE family efflux transporter [Pseudomonadota bacterium]
MNRPDRGSLFRVWHLAWPVILSNLSTPLLGVVDTAVVGRLPGPEYIAGVAVGATAFTSTFWAFGFLRMGTTGFVAQAAGAGNADEIRAVLARALLVALAIGLALLALQGPVWQAALHLLQPGAAVAHHAGAYFEIRIWTAPATLGNYALLGWFIGMQRPRLALATQIWLNGVNIVLDLVFVGLLDLGVSGVAWATLAGEWSALALGLYLALGMLRRQGGTWDRRRIFDGASLRAMLTANLDIFIRTACLIVAFGWFVRTGARFGELALAANAILIQMVGLIAHGLDGFAFAAEALIGSALGRRDLAGLRAAVISSTIWAVIVALGFAVTYWIAGPLIVALMTNQPETQAAAGTYLGWVVLYPVVAVWCFQLDGIFIGATQTADMRNAAIASLAVFAIAVLLLPDLAGNHGLWGALTLFNVARTVSLGLLYRKIERRAVPAPDLSPSGPAA